MCCVNNLREKWIISLVLVGALFSLAVAVPMILISWPGDECLLFVSVRGESLIYGHAAGCNFISASHCLVAGAALIFFIVLAVSRSRRPPAAKNPSNGSVRSLRGSVAGVSAVSFGPQAKPTILLITFSLLVLVFVLITAIVILSGYVVTCGELQYETRRKLHGSLSLGPPVANVFITCWSLFRDTDYRTRFQFDHYEYAGSWHGQYTTFRHGRPHTWTGGSSHILDIPTGLELSMASCWISSLLWAAITVLLIMHRNSVKRRNRREIAESVEDARIWASDMAAGPGSVASTHQYEMIKRTTPAPSRSQQYSNYQQYGELEAVVPGPPSDSSDIDTLLAHQNVIAHTHPEGSLFQTAEGTYVQLVNGVLTNVEFQPSPAGSVTYSQLQFQQQLQQLQQPQSFSSQTQSLPPHHQIQGLTNPPMAGLQPASHPGSSNGGGGGKTPSVTSSQLSQAATVSHISGGEVGEQENTRMKMRIQKDMATLAGMKCSQF